MTYERAIRWPGEEHDDGSVSCDPDDRIDAPGVYDPPGAPVVVIRLPYTRAEELQEALELVDETAELWAASETTPTGWKEMCVAIGHVTARLEEDGHIPRSTV